MVTVRTSRGPVRRAEILRGMLDIFLAEGFRDISLEDLAARLRCSKSTLYGVAGSKEQLITAVVREFFRAATERVEAILAAESDPTARIRVYLEAIAAELAPASADFYADLAAFPPAHEIYRRNTEVAARKVQELVSAAQRGPGVDAGFVGAVAGTVMESIQRGDLKAAVGIGDAAAYRLLADLIVRAVQGPAG